MLTASAAVVFRCAIVIKSCRHDWDLQCSVLVVRSPLTALLVLMLLPSILVDLVTVRLRRRWLTVHAAAPGSSWQLPRCSASAFTCAVGIRAMCRLASLPRHRAWSS